MASRDRDIGRKYESGSNKRKKAAQRAKLEGQLRNSLTKFLKTEVDKKNVRDIDTQKKCVLDNSSQESLQAPHHSQFECSSDSALQPMSSNPIHLLQASSSSQQELPPEAPSSPLSEDLPLEPEQNRTEQSNSEENYEIKDHDVSDPYLWPSSLTQSERTRIIEKGPVSITGENFPKNESGRHFSEVHYTRSLPNAEQQRRWWLVYSKSNDSVHCFACRIFLNSDNASASALTSKRGTDDSCVDL